MANEIREQAKTLTDYADLLQNLLDLSATWRAQGEPERVLCAQELESEIRKFCEK